MRCPPRRTGRSLGWVPLLAWLGAPLVYAQPRSPPDTAPLVPAGMGGCPSEWAHRDGDEESFSCRDTTSGAFCSGATRQASSSDLVEAVRAELLGMGWSIVREGDDGRLHSFVFDDASGHRVMRFCARGSARVVVTCGAAPAQFDALVPLFVEVAGTAI